MTRTSSNYAIRLNAVIAASSNAGVNLQFRHPLSSTEAALASSFATTNNNTPDCCYAIDDGDGNSIILPKTIQVPDDKIEAAWFQLETVERVIASRSSSLNFEKIEELRRNYPLRLTRLLHLAIKATNKANSNVSLYAYFDPAAGPMVTIKLAINKNDSLVYAFAVNPPDSPLEWTFDKIRHLEREISGADLDLTNVLNGIQLFNPESAPEGDPDPLPHNL